MRVISLGWGVQSFALAAMSALGELPPVDAAIHADTTHERSETYEFAAKWTPWLEARGVRVVTVQHKIPFPNTGAVFIPAYTLRHGKRGHLRRSCTGRWKIAPQRRWISAELEQRGLTKSPYIVEQWFGISMDEWTRMRTSDVRYIHNAYPFMEQFDPPMTRYDIGRWLLENDLEIPVKSACVFCPYHSLEAWREIKMAGNGDWEKAIEVDQIIRDKRPGYQCFVHAARVPLELVDLRNAQDHGQLELWGEECTGNCFL